MQVGVLHHTPDPVKGLRALAERLRPGGIMHIFVYSALGRREIMLMQVCIIRVLASHVYFSYV
jgi:hypothetical protein